MTEWMTWGGAAGMRFRICYCRMQKGAVPYEPDNPVSSLSSVGLWGGEKDLDNRVDDVEGAAGMRSRSCKCRVHGAGCRV